MAVRFKRNNIDLAEAKTKMEELLVTYSQDPSAANKAAVDAQYQYMTRFKSGCGTCIAGRNLMMRGLADLATGNISDAKKKIGGAVKSVSLKLDSL